ncbi:MAG: (Fe-S)-binding protein [Bacteroidales bacterium]|nr:(Fe-S)-binding protein [Bacteroidales bacterium]
MTSSQIIFISIFILTIGVFSFSMWRLYKFFKLTKKHSVSNWSKRILLVLKIAFGQTKIFRFPFAGLLHAIVFWGFLVILFGSIEMVIDGIFNLHKSLSFLGIFYNVIMAFGDIFAFLISIAVVIFIFRRIFHFVKRFNGQEMTRKNHIDALLALFLILILMISLLGMNYTESIYTKQQIYPISSYLAQMFPMCSCIAKDYYSMYWWTHIVLIFIFANILPYSKHFHIFTSIPNVFLSRLEPLGKLDTMESITKELKLMMNPDEQVNNNESSCITRFGVKDVEDVTWKTYLDSLACTQCGRCTSACPASQTGKKLSPRKLLMDLRSRMNEKAPKLLKDENFTDNKSYLGHYISLEEIWACTLCNACAKECPVNIYHPQIIIDLRRYLVLEEGKAQGGLQAVFANIENNGAPWQYSPTERLNWINT